MYDEYDSTRFLLLDDPDFVTIFFADDLDGVLAMLIFYISVFLFDEKVGLNL